MRRTPIVWTIWRVLTALRMSLRTNGDCMWLCALPPHLDSEQRGTFNLRLCEQTNMAALATELGAVAQETMQLEHVSLWLQSGGVEGLQYMQSHFQPSVLRR